MNFVDESSKRSNYENEFIDDTCLSILQNKFKNIAIVNIDINDANENNAKTKFMFENELSKINSTTQKKITNQTMSRKKILKRAKKKTRTMIRRKNF